MTAPEFDSEEQRLLCHLYAVLDRVPCCGCGNPEEAYTLIHQLLILATQRTPDRWRKVRELIGSDGAHQIVLSALNDADLLEHGGSIGGSWLTSRGRWFLWAVEQVGGIDGLEEKLEDAGFPHEWDPEAKAMRSCTGACWVMPDDWQPTPEEPGDAGADAARDYGQTCLETAASLRRMASSLDDASPVEAALGAVARHLADQLEAPSPFKEIPPSAPSRSRRYTSLPDGCYDASFGKVHVRSSCRCPR